jgi:hypothetical protein
MKWVDPLELARRCSKEQETIYKELNIYSVGWTNSLAYNAKPVDEP